MIKSGLPGWPKEFRDLIDLQDPIGEVLDTEVLENGLEIQKVRVAMGVIGIIYESRPNVTSDAAALAIKSGNAVVPSVLERMPFILLKRS